MTSTTGGGDPETVNKIIRLKIESIADDLDFYNLDWSVRELFTSVTALVLDQQRIIEQMQEQQIVLRCELKLALDEISTVTENRIWESSNEENLDSQGDILDNGYRNIAETDEKMRFIDNDEDEEDDVIKDENKEEDDQQQEVVKDSNGQEQSFDDDSFDADERREIIKIGPIISLRTLRTLGGNCLPNFDLFLLLNSLTIYITGAELT
ncbi:uncharacterized protein LOC142345745 [Convolutriloba macropyga]|uniref:uncharacterized protein LOC142345745 n=1 Tax=Convolutriloba macropyga TaxID=536237 RepID=UPI003F525E8A